MPKTDVAENGEAPLAAVCENGQSPDNTDFANYVREVDAGELCLVALAGSQADGRPSCLHQICPAPTPVLHLCLPLSPGNPYGKAVLDCMSFNKLFYILTEVVISVVLIGPAMPAWAKGCEDGVWRGGCGI